jgi:hypothetical protein
MEMKESGELGSSGELMSLKDGRQEEQSKQVGPNIVSRDNESRRVSLGHLLKPHFSKG